MSTIKAGAEWGSHSKVAAAKRWERPSAEMGRGVTEALLESAAAQPGITALDVASGTGAPALPLARQVAPSGRVMGLDIALEPLLIASARARERGLANVFFLRADVHKLPFASSSFDLLTSRLGVMFFSDLRQALREMHRVLKPQGRVVLLTWGAMDQPYFTSTIGVVLRQLHGLEVPAPARAMFQMGEKGRLSLLLAEAGFSRAAEDLRIVPWIWTESAEELWAYFQAVTVPFRPLLERIPPEKRATIDEQVRAELERYSAGGQVRMSAQVMIATGVKA